MPRPNVPTPSPLIYRRVAASSGVPALIASRTVSWTARALSRLDTAPRRSRLATARSYSSGLSPCSAMVSGECGRD